MDKPQSIIVETFELTEIVEEGLPLDELPEIYGDETSGVLSEIDSGKIDAVVLEPEGERVEVLEFDGALDDLESAFTGSVGAVSDSVVEVGVDDVPETESGDGEASSELIAGYTGAVLGDDEFTEVEIPEGPESHDPVLAELKSAGLKPESFVSPETEAEVELPEDYLTDEEMPEIKAESEPVPPEVYAEPISPDFSSQIESMTQEWSKQLLQTTYASMDKMIKAIGDLAPTIVDQVAREVIPPLAEKVIKAEIARLEEKLAREEDQEEISSS